MPGFLGFIMGDIAADTIMGYLPRWAVLLITGLVVALIVRGMLRYRKG